MTRLIPIHSAEGQRGSVLTLAAPARHPAPGVTGADLVERVALLAAERDTAWSEAEAARAIRAELEGLVLALRQQLASREDRLRALEDRLAAQQARLQAQEARLAAQDDLLRTQERLLGDAQARLAALSSPPRGR